MPTTDFKFTGRKGFTLVELMVAIGVTALLVSLMLTITLNVMGGWNKSSGSLTSGNQARLVLDMIARDLQGAVIKKDGNVWLAATLQDTQPTNGGDAGMTGSTPDAVWSTVKTSSTLSTDPTSTSTSFVIPALVGSNPIPALEDYRFKQGGTWLRFFTSITDTNTPDITSGGSTTDSHVSAPRAVAYQIVRAPVVFGSLEYRYQLFRSEVSSENSFAAGYDLFAAPYNSVALVNERSEEPTTIKGAGIIRRPETAANDRRLVIANNVIDFGVRVFTRNSSSVTVSGTAPGALFPTPSFPAVGFKGFAATTLSTAVPATKPQSEASLATGEFVKDIPAVVEVFMRVLTDEGVLQIDNLENGRITGNWWDIALKNSKVFTRRVELNSAGL
jgi:prepilin-type N-terminal cleavage/methylation domain-containing protein